MPFDLFVSRATSYDALSTARALRLSELGPPPGAREAPGGGYWLEHPGGGPWLAVVERGPNVVLSTSYSNRRFVRNFVDAFDLAHQLAAAVGARVFDEVSAAEVPASQLNALLRPLGPYVARQHATFQEVERRIREEAQARLEYPLGEIDLVSDYFVFVVVGSTTPDGVAAALSASFGGRVVRDSVRTFRVAPAETRGWLARTLGRQPDPATLVLVRPDGAVQVWPSWAHPFATLAATTVEVARALAASTHGALHFGRTRVDAPLLEAIETSSRGLGVDFHRWWAARA
ncbi:MAG: hypothetical protein R3B99_38205 [Polyangiales bacterium]